MDDSASRQNVSKHWKDIIQKYVSALFKDVTLEFYGIEMPKIKELISVDLPVVEVRDSKTDQVFLTENDTYLHLAFETGYRKKTMVRHLEYDTRLFARDGREVYTVIVYTSDVKNVPPPLKNGSTAYNPGTVLMVGYDGDTIYKNLDAKLNSGLELTDVDVLNLIFLPLMRSELPRMELAEKTIRLAQNISDETKKNACTAATLAFAWQYLDSLDIEKLLEVAKMTHIAELLVRDARKEWENNAELLVKDAVRDARQERETEIAMRMLRRGVSIETVVEDTGLSEAMARHLQGKIGQA